MIAGYMIYVKLQSSCILPLKEPHSGLGGGNRKKFTPIFFPKLISTSKNRKNATGIT